MLFQICGFPKIITKSNKSQWKQSYFNKKSILVLIVEENWEETWSLGFLEHWFLWPSRNCFGGFLSFLHIGSPLTAFIVFIS